MLKAYLVQIGFTFIHHHIYVHNVFGHSFTAAHKWIFYCSPSNIKSFYHLTEANTKPFILYTPAIISHVLLPIKRSRINDQ